VPERTCIGCRSRAPADTLVRIAWSPTGGRLVTGPGHSGRGAWLCPDAECLDLAMQRDAVGRALRVGVPAAAAAELVAGWASTVAAAGPLPGG